MPRRHPHPSPLPSRRRGLAVRSFWSIVLAALTLQVVQAHAHGGLSMDEDMCKLRVGRYLMHFVGYQPDSAAATEFCEDIPETGRTVVVLDYLNDELRDLPTEVRIIRDTGSEANLDDITVFHLPPAVHPTGTLHFEHVFPDAGQYVGLVTVGGREKLVSRFPFSVGKPRSTLPMILAGVLIVAAGVALYVFSARRRERSLPSK
jgi:hypothetical protein